MGTWLRHIVQETVVGIPRHGNAPDAFQIGTLRPELFGMSGTSALHNGAYSLSSVPAAM